MCRVGPFVSSLASRVGRRRRQWADKQTPRVASWTYNLPRNLVRAATPGMVVPGPVRVSCLAAFPQPATATELTADTLLISPFFQIILHLISFTTFAPRCARHVAV